MNDEQTKKIIEDNCDVSGEDTLMSMAKDFYSRTLISTVILVWVWAIIFVAGAAYCGIKFFEADQTKSQIMYAALFACCFNGICLMKILGCQMIHRQGIKREIKKLKK